tara:strand:+ start:117 stop:434 length:318 start_codon:yes stop_codon:yes gene_type:complete
MTKNLRKHQKTKCVYCGKKVYPIFIQTMKLERTESGTPWKFMSWQQKKLNQTFERPRNLIDFYYCKKHGIQRDGICYVTGNWPNDKKRQDQYVISYPYEETEQTR